MPIDIVDSAATVMIGMRIRRRLIAVKCKISGLSRLIYSDGSPPSVRPIISKILNKLIIKRLFHSSDLMNDTGFA